MEKLDVAVFAAATKILVEMNAVTVMRSARSVACGVVRYVVAVAVSLKQEYVVNAASVLMMKVDVVDVALMRMKRTKVVVITTALE